MSDISILEQAKQLFENGLYSKSLDACIALLKDNRDNLDRKTIREGSLLSAKATLYTMGTPNNETDQEAVCGSVRIACNYSDSLEEVYQVETEILEEYDRWHEYSLRKRLDDLEANPSINAWQPLIHYGSAYQIFRLLLMASTRGSEAVEKYCEEEGITTEGYGERFKFLESTFESDDEGDLIYATGVRIFANVKKDLESTSINLNNAEMVVNSAVNRLITAKLMVSYDSKDKIARKKTEAEILTYLLNKTIYIDGKGSLSLYHGDRQQDINKIKRLYAEISELDPNFVAPPLPSETAVKPQSTASGGCYVATAVYGSYDCPQVWTLRRYRDYTLSKTGYGRAFIHTYYAISPTLVKWFGRTEWFRNMWKPMLDRMVNTLNSEGVLNTPYNDKQW